MIELTQGNILRADAEALVNTVNCVGFMGKGIALQFKKAYPENFEAYRKACTAREVWPGRMFIFGLRSMLNPKYVINFPTKGDWRANSRYEDIETGLKALVAEVRRLVIRSIAIPPLGCGLGGLDWNRVRPMIERAFADLTEVRLLLFEPSSAPEAKAMPVRTERPRLTVARDGALCHQLVPPLPAVPGPSESVMNHQVFVHRHRVHYADCTLGNHIYYARFLDLLEAARGEMFRQLGQTFLRWQEEGFLFPVLEVHLRYHRPARYDDELDIALWVTRLNGARLNFGCTIRNRRMETVLEGETCHICTSLEEKPRRIPSELVAALRPYLQEDCPETKVGRGGGQFKPAGT